MIFTKIDTNTWNRAEHFQHFMIVNPCIHSTTVKIDITRVRASRKKLYPAMLYAITKIVNCHEEFRMALDENGAPGYFDQMLPVYTIFHADTETFSNLWTPWQPQYEPFLEAYEKDRKMYGAIKSLVAKPDVPPNAFPVSMIPWTSFDGFHLNVKEPYGFLFPIFTMGKFYEENGKVLLPLSIQIHHAACDGFHIGRFLRELQEELDRDF